MTSEQKFNCILCKDTFDSKDDLQIHFRKHGDPIFNQKSRARFPKATETSGDKPSDKLETVGCDVCSEVFTTISKAITHKHKVHPDHDAKYFCPWCGKLFTMKHLYNKHIQSTHEGADRPDDRNFHCDICAVDFYIPSAVAYHNKFFHRQDTDYPDMGQSKKFKLHNQEVMPLFYCAFCGEEYDNKINLFKHMTDDHSDENQSPDEVLRCPLCEAIFYHLDAYEIHTTFHTPDDLYSIKNEMYSDLQEFSLESLPPVVEKVENMESHDNDPESAMNSVGIDKFLELAMDQSQDAPAKAKKHKKHKKSKKSAITLDEFLNMNKDVFGEGLDFQGIEEVPTRVVTKRLKGNKKTTNANAKTVTPVELEKLKQQGIVIKKKVSGNPSVHGMKVLQGVPTWTTKNTSKGNQNKVKPETELNTSNEVLSKLMSQSNNTIKIVKKSTQDNTKTETEQTAKVEATDDEDDCPDKITAMPINRSQPKSDEEDNLEDAKDDLSNNIADDKFMRGSHNSEESLAPKPTMLVSKPDCNKNMSHLDKEVDEPIGKDLLKSDSLLCSTNPEKSQNALISLNTLQNKGQIVIKRKSNNQINTVNLKRSDESEPEESGKEESDADDINNDDKMQENTDTNKSHASNSSNKSLSALQHLSHLVVKPINSTKTISFPISKTTGEENTDEEDLPDKLNLVLDPSKPIPLPPPNAKESINPIKQPNETEKDPTIDALKNLSRNIIIKSIPKSVESENTPQSDFEEDNEMEDDIDSERLVTSVIEGSESTNVLKKNVVCTKNEPKVVPSLNNAQENNVHSPISKINIPNSVKCTQNKNENLLKRLTNITTKSITPQKVGQVRNPTIIPRKFIPQQSEIETFNIDDSEDENDDNVKSTELQNTAKPIAFKNISKNITIKSVNQQLQKNIKIENNDTQSDEEQDDEVRNPCTDDSEDETNNINTQEKIFSSTKLCGQKFSNRNISIKNALKNLGNNVTVKSRNPSPSMSIKSQDHTSQDSNIETNEECDSDSNPGKVKITEIDNDMSDEEINTQTKIQHTADAIVQSPDDSCSDDNGELDDFEKDIKANTLQKPQENSNSSKNPMILNTLKNLSKNITIKSLSDHTEKGPPKIDNDIPSNVKKQSFNECTTEGREVARINTNPRNVSRVEYTDQRQKMSSSNQVNTVNKEVTVKTFQTQTVIQEITTTVTKTIKTINQSVKQQVRNSSQINSPMKPQKVQGIRPNQPKNLQGVIVRQASPHIGTKIGNAGSQVRPAAAAIRPSKQLALVRPGLNITRPNTPRMPVLRKPPPSPSSQKQVIGKTLKISPNAMTVLPAVKRPNCEDITGPFSCFKKPKESLIPVSEVPNFSGESIAQYASTSHTNFTSTTKVVKGNAVVTSTQVKSEKTACAKQISKLSNNTGLTIVKTSQAKQMQTHEKNETNSMKQTTLAAIEKLQKQGLLVKKPRLEANEDSENSDPGDGEHLGYSSDEEFNV